MHFRIAIIQIAYSEEYSSILIFQGAVVFDKCLVWVSIAIPSVTTISSTIEATVSTISRIGTRVWVSISGVGTRTIWVAVTVPAVGTSVASVARICAVASVCTSIWVAVAVVAGSECEVRHCRSH